MRTRNLGVPKPAAVKKTPPARRSASKTPPARRSASKTPPSAAAGKRGSAAKAALAKCSEEVSLTPGASSDFKPEQSPGDAGQATPETGVATATETVAKRTLRTRTCTSGKAVPRPTTKSKDALEAEESSKSAKDDECEKLEESVNIEESAEKEEDKMEMEEYIAGSAAESIEEQQTAVGNDEEPLNENVVECTEEHANEEAKSMEVKASPIENNEDSSEQEKPFITEAAKSAEDELPCGKEEEEMTKEHKVEEVGNNEVQDPEEMAEDNDDIGEDKRENVDLEENIKEQLQEDTQTEREEVTGDEGIDEYVDRVDFGEHGEEEPSIDDVEEPEETLVLEEEHRELSAIAEERKIKKEHEIFVGGLEREATEEDVKQVFEKIGEIVEVRLHKNFTTNKNKGYAFVKFANKADAKRALSEMKNPIICGKRCGTAPSEDNDTLFLGNICNTWTKEAIRQKLKDYGVEGVESITLVPDVQREGLSRGFAFLEFACHADAMLAYKRLQKPDAIFGHPERTVKVAFAEPLREPDPDIMAQVKSVFIDGIPPHWDEDYVRNQFKGYGEIARIVLARNLSTAKRKDYGFIDFSSHEAAVACVDGINSAELGDGNSKTKVRVRLSNPLPKTQAVKGGMCGGFRIGGSTSDGTFPKFGRGFGRGGLSLNRPNFQRGRGFYQGGRGQTGRMGLPNEYGFDNPYADFHGRQNFGRGGRRGFFRGGHHTSGRGASLGRPWHDISDTDHGRFIPPRRQPYSPEGRFDRPYPGRHINDPYMFDDGAHGIKRPFHMTEHDPGYMEPDRVRPRLDYNDQAVPFRGTRYHGSFGSGSSMYNHDYHGSDYAGGYESYGGGPYPPYYRGDRPYGGDHPYGSGRPYGGDRPYGSDRPYGGDRLYGGDRPYGGDRLYGSDQPYAGDRPYGVDHPYGGDRPHRGGYYY